MTQLQVSRNNNHDNCYHHNQATIIKFRSAYGKQIFADIIFLDLNEFLRSWNIISQLWIRRYEPHPPTQSKNYSIKIHNNISICHSSKFQEITITINVISTIKPPSLSYRSAYGKPIFADINFLDMNEFQDHEISWISQR